MSKQTKDLQGLGPQKRFVTLRKEPATQPLDANSRTMTLSFSSEEPVERWFGSEILSHAKGAMRQGQRQDSMPLLFNHDLDDLLGVVESVSVGADGRGYAQVRFGKDPRGDWAMQQVADGILTNVSFMYQVYRFDEDLENDVYTGTDWEPFEISLVTVPADPSVGADRAQGDSAVSVVVETRESAIQPAQAIIKESPEMKPQARLQDQAHDGTAGSAGGAGVVDAGAIRAQTETEVRSFMRECDAMATAHKLSPEFRSSLMVNAKNIEEARGMVLVEIQKRTEAPKPLSSLTDEIGLTSQEKASYSLQRAINALVSNSWKGAGFERELHVALAKRNGRDPENCNFMFPNDLPFAPTQEHARVARMMGNREQQQRAIYQVGATPGSGTTGGTLIQTNLLADSFIEVLRNQSVTAKLGAMMLPGLVGEVDIPRQSLATATYWVGESGALTEAEMTFDKVSLRPKTVGALSKVSRLMLLQSTPAIEMLIRADLAKVGALAIDSAALVGTGTSMPLGIANQPSVVPVIGGTNGAALTFDNLIQMKYSIRVQNAPTGNNGYAINSKCIGYLATLKATTGQYLWNPAGGLMAGTPDTLIGSQYAESQQLAYNLTKGTSVGNCSEIIYGNWQELIIGEWGITEIAVNPYDSTGFTTGDVIVRMFQTVDVQLRHSASFSYMTDALTPGF